MVPWEEEGGGHPSQQSEEAGVFGIGGPRSCFCYSIYLVTCIKRNKAKGANSPRFWLLSLGGRQAARERRDSSGAWLARTFIERP